MSLGGIVTASICLREYSENYPWTPRLQSEQRRCSPPRIPPVVGGRRQPDNIRRRQPATRLCGKLHAVVRTKKLARGTRQKTKRLIDREVCPDYFFL